MSIDTSKVADSNSSAATASKPNRAGAAASGPTTGSGWPR